MDWLPSAIRAKFVPPTNSPPWARRVRKVEKRWWDERLWFVVTYTSGWQRWQPSGI